MSFYTTQEAALAALGSFRKTSTTTFQQLADDYQKYLAIYLNVPEDKLTNAQLLEQYNFKFFSNAAGGLACCTRSLAASNILAWKSVAASVISVEG
eukprot:evm.model.NODE_8941_length_7211_cov_36.003605.3